MIDELLKATKEERWLDARKLLYKHWVVASRAIYPAQVQRPWEAVTDETKIADELLYPLAAMFCAESSPQQTGQSKDVSLRRLKEVVDLDESKARSGQICGKMFKNGEPNYTCKECATDGTCVLCYECFINSAHMNHKYKMHTSLGSGYCDCGDREAWSNDYACKLHSVRMESETQEADLDCTGLPSQISNRLHRLSLLTLRFAVNLLCWDQTEQFPDIIDANLVSEEEASYQTILFNDETHTYEGVIRALELSINECTASNAMRLATIVDREGRAIVTTGSRTECERVKQSIESRTKKDTNRRTQKTGPLLVKVYRSSLSALQLLSIRLLGWLSAQAQEFPPLATIISESLLYGCPDCEETAPLSSARQGRLQKVCDCAQAANAVYLVLFDRRLWKSARTAFHQLLMSTVLMDLDHKNVFGRFFIRNYNVIFDDFIEDDHEHSVSVTSMTVQIFTVPTVARRLISEEGALHVCMNHLRKFCRRYIAESSFNPLLRQMNFANDPYPAVLRRALYMLNDVGYLLTLVPKDAEEWTDGLRKEFDRGAHTFLRFLNMMQGMDEVKRQHIEHQLMESEWETAFNIFLRLQEPVSLLLAWARSDPQTHLALYLKTLQQMNSIADISPEFKMERVRVEVNGHHAYCVPFEVSRGAISVHQPLWRFLSGLMCAPEHILHYYGVDEQCKFSITQAENPRPLIEQVLAAGQRMNMNGVRTLMLELPLRVLVLNAQAGAAQLWRRNGFSLVNQIHNYSSNLCRTEMYDRDVQLLQVVAAVMDPNKFLIRILDRFGLAKWAEVGFEDWPQQPHSIEGTTQEENSKIFSVLAEELFHLLIILLGERYSVGLSPEATAQRALEREIVHILSTGPKPFSHIEKYIPNDPAIQRLSLENAVRNVGDFRRPTTVTSGQFHLKESLRSEYNPFFWHYSKHLGSLAEQQQQKERAGLSRELKACAPPVPPRFSPYFAPILRIMNSELFVKLLRVVFERAAKRSRFVSDGLFYRGLFLSGMALNEQKKAHDEGRPFEFLQLAQTEAIFDTLTRLQDKPEVEAHNDLLWWVVKTYNHVAALYAGEHPPSAGSRAGEDANAGDNGGKAKNAQKAAIAARKRQLALERMRQLQNSFKTQHISLADSAGAISTHQQEDTASMGGAIEETESAVLASDAGFPVCCGLGKSGVELRPQQTVMCILCQEDEAISFDGNPMVCSTFVQNSQLFARHCVPQATPQSDAHASQRNAEHLNIFASIDLPQELYISTCSHLMHFSCYNTFIESVNARERARNRPHMLNARMLNVDANEYLCPLCKRLSNCVLPVFPPIQSLSHVFGFSTDRPVDLDRSSSMETFDSWIADLSTLVTQPVTAVAPSPKKPAFKGHSRKRSHSERSLAEHVKSGQQQPASTAEEPLANSSIASLPTELESVLGGGLSDQQLNAASSSSSISPISDAIAGQVQAMQNQNMLNEGGAAIVQQLLAYVFGPKKMSPKGMDQSNVPSSIPHWKTLKPLMDTLEKTSLSADSPSYVMSGRQPSRYSRFSETLNVLRACAFLVRSVAGVLEAENKPLFGAYNTRQRDCITAFVRVAMLAPFNCQPAGLRVLVSRLLSPLLAPPFNEDELQQNIAEQRVGTSKKAADSFLSPTRIAQTQLYQAFCSEVGIMQIDMQTLAVELVLCIGWSWTGGKRVLHNMHGVETIYKVADGSLDELYAVQLTLLAHIFQVVELFKSEMDTADGQPEPHIAMPADKGGENKVAPDFDEFMNRLRKLFPQYQTRWTRQSEIALYKRIHSAAIAFLRPLAILYNAITLIPPPEALKDPSVDNLIPLCRYLGLPSSIIELFAGAKVEYLFRMWSLHQKGPIMGNEEVRKLTSTISKLPSDKLAKIVKIANEREQLTLTNPHDIGFDFAKLAPATLRELESYLRNDSKLHLPLRMNTLIELPEDFSHLINMAVSYRCPEVCELTSNIPTLCLSCGEMLCSQSYCCQRTVNGRNVGACTYHLSRCRSSSGVFLRIRECQIIFLLVTGEHSRGCFKPAPYVDEFGETDPGFRRGNPMRLNRELYWKIRRQWIHQEVAEEVINQYELNHRNIAFDWHHF